MARKLIVSGVNHGAPAPLGYVAAVDRAAELRALGGHWSYTVIADVMRLYHGFDRSHGWWGDRLAERGMQRPRGVPFVRRGS